MVFRKEEFLAATKDWAVPQKFAPIWAKFAVRNSFVLRWNDATGRYQFLFALAINVLPCPTHRLTHFRFVFSHIRRHQFNKIYGSGFHHRQMVESTCRLSDFAMFRFRNVEESPRLLQEGHCQRKH